MYCTRCGTPSDAAAIFCKNCQAALSPPVSLIKSHEQPESSVLQVRPWVRYWGRVFDLSLFGLLVSVGIQMFFPSASPSKAGEVGFHILAIFSWVLVESLLLTVFGTTLGKALFRTRVRLTGSDSIPFIFALHRSLRVWWRGLGAGIPIVTLFTLLHAETVLTRDSITSWDRELGFVVTHEKIGASRVVIAVAWFAAWFGLSIFEVVAEAKY